MDTGLTHEEEQDDAASDRSSSDGSSLCDLKRRLQRLPPVNLLRSSCKRETCAYSQELRDRIEEADEREEREQRLLTPTVPAEESLTVARVRTARERRRARAREEDLATVKLKFAKAENANRRDPSANNFDQILQTFADIEKMLKSDEHVQGLPTAIEEGASTVLQQSPCSISLSASPSTGGRHHETEARAKESSVSNVQQLRSPVTPLCVNKSRPLKFGGYRPVPGMLFSNLSSGSESDVRSDTPGGSVSSMRRIPGSPVAVLDLPSPVPRTSRATLLPVVTARNATGRLENRFLASSPDSSRSLADESNARRLFRETLTRPTSGASNCKLYAANSVKSVSREPFVCPSDHSERHISNQVRQDVESSRGRNFRNRKCAERNAWTSVPSTSRIASKENRGALFRTDDTATSDDAYLDSREFFSAPSSTRGIAAEDACVEKGSVTGEASQAFSDIEENSADKEDSAANKNSTENVAGDDLKDFDNGGNSSARQTFELESSNVDVLIEEIEQDLHKTTLNCRMTLLEPKESLQPSIRVSGNGRAATYNGDGNNLRGEVEDSLNPSTRRNNYFNASRRSETYRDVASSSLNNIAITNRSLDDNLELTDYENEHPTDHDEVKNIVTVPALDIDSQEVSCPTSAESSRWPKREIVRTEELIEALSNASVKQKSETGDGLCGTISEVHTNSNRSTNTCKVQSRESVSNETYHLQLSKSLNLSRESPQTPPRKVTRSFIPIRISQGTASTSVVLNDTEKCVCRRSEIQSSQVGNIDIDFTEEVLKIPHVTNSVLIIAKGGSATTLEENIKESDFAKDTNQPTMQAITAVKRSSCDLHTATVQPGNTQLDKRGAHNEADNPFSENTIETGSFAPLRNKTSRGAVTEYWRLLSVSDEDLHKNQQRSSESSARDLNVGGNSAGESKHDESGDPRGLSEIKHGSSLNKESSTVVDIPEEDKIEIGKQWKTSFFAKRVSDTLVSLEEAPAKRIKYCHCRNQLTPTFNLNTPFNFDRKLPDTSEDVDLLVKNSRRKENERIFDTVKSVRSEAAVLSAQRARDALIAPLIVSSSTSKLDRDSPKGSLRFRKKSQDRFPFTISESTSAISTRFEAASEQAQHFCMENDEISSEVYCKLHVHPSITRLANAGFEESPADIICYVNRMEERRDESRYFVPRMKKLVKRFSDILRRSRKQYADTDDEGKDSAKVIYENRQCQEGSFIDSCSEVSSAEDLRKVTPFRSLSCQRVVLDSSVRSFAISGRKSSKTEESRETVVLDPQHLHRRYDRDDQWVKDLQDSNSNTRDSRRNLAKAGESSASADRLTVFLARASSRISDAVKDGEFSSARRHDRVVILTDPPTSVSEKDKESKREKYNCTGDRNDETEKEGRDASIEKSCLCLRCCWSVRRRSQGTTKRNH